jgi:ADP-ribose pyrophosphatase YjhB (NUDIX family)
MITRSGDNRPRQRCTICGRIHYRNAKPCAGALIVRDGRVLLLKRTIQPFLGHWDIPGGYLEEDEHPEVGVIREVREETSLEIRVNDLFGIYLDRYGDRSTHYCLNIYYLAEVVGGNERANDEASDLAWFAPSELPNKIAFEHAAVVLADWARSMEAKTR